MNETSGQAIAEFSLVILLLVPVLFSVLEMGLILNHMSASEVSTATAYRVQWILAVDPRPEGAEVV